METQLVVLGGGPGGYAAAFFAADLGMHVTLVDLEPRLGGTCLLRGCIPSKALLHVAKSMSEAAHLADWGVKFAKPAIDLAAMRARKDKVIATLTGGLKQIAGKRNVKHHAGQGHVRGRQHAAAATGRQRAAGRRPASASRHCILASGSRPSTIPAFNLPTPRVMDSTSALELPDIPESLLVVGGGYIGLEMGTVYAALGTRVSVVELTDGLLPGADRDLVRPLHKKLAGEFAEIMLSTKVVSMADKGQAIEVTFEPAAGGDRKVQQYSRVLVSVGRRPNSDGIGLENTKVKIDRHGFVADRSAAADGRAADLGHRRRGRPADARAQGGHEGRSTVEAILGHNVAFAPRAIPAVVFTDPEIAWAGLTETEAKAQGRAVEVAHSPGRPAAGPKPSAAPRA